MIRKVIISIFLVVLISVSLFPVSAAVTESYIRTDVPGGTEIRISKEMYYAEKNITAQTLGLDESLEGITDITCDNNGDIFILCGIKSRLIHMDSNYNLVSEIKVKESGEEVNFTGAQGIYSDSKGNLFIADTSNARILIIDFNGNVISKIETPESDLIPEDFLFQPTTVEKDQQGYTYVLSLGCYYGALLYTPEYEFMGFYGANTVKASALDTLSYLWERLTSTEEKKAASEKTLPYSFTDFCFDRNGFMVTITGTISSNRYVSSTLLGHIRKISHNGANILYKRTLDGETTSSSQLDFLEKSRPDGTNVQDFVSVEESEDGYIFVLDAGNGTVYIYDGECNLMSAFGGGYNEGAQLGIFKNAAALTLNGDSVLVADEADRSITVFKPTEYGKLIRKAQAFYLKGDYDEAKELWEDVLSLNRNCQLAYRGLAMAYYNEGDYDGALEAARIALDRSVYNLAFKEIVSDFIADYFVIIVIVIVAVIGLAVCLGIYLKKRNRKLIENKKLSLLFKVPFHPFDSFDELKYKKQGSLSIAIVITVLFYIASVLNVIACGFLYSNTLLRNYNSFYTLAATAGLLLLWSVCNWLVCCTFSGKGNFKEVYISTSYSIVPWIIFIFIKVIMTNFIPLESSGLITGIETAVLLFTFFLLSVAMMKIHEYDFFKFLWTGLVTVFFMILVLFIIFMCAILIAQFASFIGSLYEEVVYR